MNILSKLEERRDGNSYSAMIPTKSGKFELSVIAGLHLYSTPRTFTDKMNYSSVEVVVMKSDSNDWASYNDLGPYFRVSHKRGEYSDEIFCDKENDYRKRTDEELNKPQISVFGYMDLSEVSLMIESL